MYVTIGIFLVTYAAIAIGRVPGFRVDRTGAALLGAIALLVFEKITPEAAWTAVDFPTIALLFGLMIVSTSFAVSGFYDWVAHRATSMKLGPRALLAVMIGTSAVLSSILTNDVVVVAMVPLIMQLTLARRLNPVPFLLGFCFAANAGSAGTIIGSPQNMIIAQGMNLSFTGFMKAAAIPSILSLLPIWGVLCLIYRRRWDVPAPGGTAPAGVAPVPLNVLETAKATVVTVLVIAAFMLTSWPRELIALGAGAVLLVNRTIASGDMLKHVDGNLFILLGGLFVVNAALATTGLPQRVLTELQGLGLDLQNPLALFLMIGALSDIVGNNPAALLVVPYVQADNGELAGVAMALGTGFASNIIVFGSLAGIIVVQSAEQHGLSISLAEYSRAGIPVTVLSMLIGAGWLLLLA